MVTRIKICGITNLKDALMCAELGADALGFIFCASPRKISPEEARKIIKRLPPFIIRTGIFKDMPLSYVAEIVAFTGIDAVQFHGSETPQYCEHFKRLRVIKRIKVGDGIRREGIIEEVNRYAVSAYLFDPGEGSGNTFDWFLIKDIKKRMILAGGLNEKNVQEVIRILKPYGIDVCSGVEEKVGKKDPIKVRNFIEEVRRCSLLE